MSDDTQACPVCGETIKAVAIKCRFCNTDLGALAAAPEAEVETMIFTGHPAVIYSAWQWLAVVFTLGLARVYLYGIPKLEQLADILRECSLRERTRRRLTTFVQA